MFISKSKKSPFYQLTYEVNGKRTTISTKTSSLKEARIFLKNFNQEFQLPVQQTEFVLLSQFRDEYLEYVSTMKSKSYIKSIKLSFRMLINFTGDKLLNHLDLRTLDKFITITFARTQMGAALYYRSLKSAFSKAVLWNYIQENPFKKIKAPKTAKTFPVFITVTEFELILEKTKEDFLRILFQTAFFTGMRLGELVNMKWSWIDFQSNQIIVKCNSTFSTKSRKERIIPINQKLLNILLVSYGQIGNANNDNFVFTRKINLQLKEDYVSKKFKDAVRLVGLNSKFHFHTLRHSFASLLVQKGVSLYIIKELLGHEDLVTTQIYSHLGKNNLRNAINLL